MSMPFVALFCTECDFQSTTRVMWGARSYLTGRTRVPIRRTLGWCFDCQTFCPIEMLADKKRIRSLKVEISEKEAVVLNAKLDVMNNRSWLKRLLNMKIVLPDKIEQVAREVNSLQRELTEEVSRVELLATRKSPPRCLECGSTETELVNADFNHFPSLDEPQESFSIGFHHPQCGGEILGEPSGMRVSVRLQHRGYNREGVFIQIIEEV